MIEQTSPTEIEQANEPFVSSEELFRGQREVFLELDGIRYRLRITKNNKLILDK